MKNVDGGHDAASRYEHPGYGILNLSAAAGFVLAVIARVAVETTRDPTSS